MLLLQVDRIFVMGIDLCSWLEMLLLQVFGVFF